MPNSLERELHSIQSSKAYCKKELKKYQDNPIITEKITHYIDGLEKEEERILKELRR